MKGPVGMRSDRALQCGSQFTTSTPWRGHPEHYTNPPGTVNTRKRRNPRHREGMGRGFRVGRPDERLPRIRLNRIDGACQPKPPPGSHRPRPLPPRQPPEHTIPNPATNSELQTLADHRTLSAHPLSLPRALAFLGEEQIRVRPATLRVRHPRFSSHVERVHVSGYTFSQPVGSRPSTHPGNCWSISLQNG